MREGHGADPIGIPLERRYTFTSRRFPELDSHVIGPRCELAAVRREGHGADKIGMPLEHRRTCVPV